MATAIEHDKKPQQEPLEVTVEYEDAAGRKVEEPFKIDFAAFENFSRVGEAPLYTIAKVDREAPGETFENLSNGMNKLSVLAYSLDDLAAERSSRNLSRKLRCVSPDGRKEIENLIDQKISLLSTKSVDPPQSGEGE